MQVIRIIPLVYAIPLRIYDVLLRPGPVGLVVKNGYFNR